MFLFSIPTFHLLLFSLSSLLLLSLLLSEVFSVFLNFRGRYRTFSGNARDLRVIVNFGCCVFQAKSNIVWRFQSRFLRNTQIKFYCITSSESLKTRKNVRAPAIETSIAYQCNNIMLAVRNVSGTLYITGSHFHAVCSSTSDFEQFKSNEFVWKIYIHKPLTTWRFIFTCTRTSFLPHLNKTLGSHFT